MGSPLTGQKLSHGQPVKIPIGRFCLFDFWQIFRCQGGRVPLLTPQRLRHSLLLDQILILRTQGEELTWNGNILTCSTEHTHVISPYDKS